MNPLVSVIVPMYNPGEPLQENIYTITNQTYENLEIIYVDDGSTDQSIALIQKHASIDNRIKLLLQENKSAGAARNYGMRHANGEYLIFLDSDDFFDLKMIEKLFLNIKNYDADISMCGAFSFDHASKEYNKRSWVLRKNLTPMCNPFSAKSIGDNVFSFTTPVTWNKLFSRRLIKENSLEFQEISRSNDLSFVLTAIAIAPKIVVNEDPLVYYRVNNSNSLQASKDKDIYSFYEALLCLRNNLEKFGVLQDLKGPFLDFAMESCRHNLNTLKDRKKFVELFYFIKNKILQELTLNENASEFYDGFSRKNGKFAHLISNASIETFIYEFKLNQFE